MASWSPFRATPLCWYARCSVEEFLVCHARCDADRARTALKTKSLDRAMARNLQTRSAYQQSRGGLEEMLTLASSGPKECSRCSLAGACQWKGRQCGGLGEDQLGRIDASTISKSCEAQEMGVPPSFAKHRLLVLFQGSSGDRELEGSARTRQRQEAGPYSRSDNCVWCNFDW